MAFAIITLWLGLLFSTIGIAASDFFSVNLSTIAHILGMSDNLAGVTFLAFGNGSPDIFSTFAAMSTNSGSLAVGELIGAGSFITAVIAGSIAFVRPFKVPRKTFVRDVCFFIIAASFSFAFLSDGKLMLWEACALVGLYVFYVAFVLVWHWYLHRRRIRRLKVAAAREYFVVPGSEDVVADQRYVDEDEEATVSRSRPGTACGPSAQDLAALEQANDSDDEDAEEQADHAAVSINRAMRLSRPSPARRRNTYAPIRPSLVGALEYQAVLAELQKSSNIQTMPIHLRRYSDDPRVTLNDGQPFTISESSAAPSTESHPENKALLRPSATDRTATGNRLRAVSVNDADALLLGTNTVPTLETHHIDLLGSLEDDNASGQLLKPGPSTTAASGSPPSISLSPPSSEAGRSASPTPLPRTPTSPTFLAPPEPYRQGSHSTGSTSGSAVSPQTKPREYPKVNIPPKYGSKSSPKSPFPIFTDGLSLSPVSVASSIRLPPPHIPIISPDSRYQSELVCENRKPLSWWPYTILPPPERLLSTLFPTLCRWRKKNIWQKIVGLISAPSVFLLTITLPVVETEREDECKDKDIVNPSLPGTVSSHSTASKKTAPANRVHRTDSTTPLLVEPSYEGDTAGSVNSNDPGRKRDMTVSVGWQQERAHHESHNGPQLGLDIVQSPEELPILTDESSDDSDDWNRWLVIIQLFTAPMFMVLIIWANTDQDHPKALIQPTLISLLCSCVCLVLLLVTTTAARPPRWRALFCFLGFAVSISWISTIANEVVGVLKALGVILNISDAILGLTIFAVGNSCGDLVANITVAKLGWPVMALSACFGGPMLNILLGIGLSAMYLILTGASQRIDKHPGKQYKIKPYHIDVSKTLMISGATLLATLLVLLILVPLRKWRMDRFIGWILIVLWIISTVANVAVEMTGLTKAISI